MRCATKGVIESNHGMPSSRKGSSCATVSAIKSNLSMPSIPRMSCATTGAIECGLKGEDGGGGGGGGSLYSAAGLFISNVRALTKGEMTKTERMIPRLKRRMLPDLVV